MCRDRSRHIHVEQAIADQIRCKLLISPRKKYSHCIAEQLRSFTIHLCTTTRFITKIQVAELGYEVAASNGAFLLDSGKIRLNGGVFQGNAVSSCLCGRMKTHGDLLNPKVTGEVGSLYNSLETLPCDGDWPLPNRTASHKISTLSLNMPIVLFECLVDGGVCRAGEIAEPVWSETMALRLHVLAALKGQLVSFLAIGDAFFYGKAGLRR